MSRSREKASRHCKLGRDCGVCHPGKPQPPPRDVRKGLGAELRALAIYEYARSKVKPR